MQPNSSLLAVSLPVSGPARGAGGVSGTGVSSWTARISPQDARYVRDRGFVPQLVREALVPMRFPGQEVYEPS